MSSNIPVAYATSVPMPSASLPSVPSARAAYANSARLPSSSRDVNSSQIKALKEQGYTQGLAQSLAANKTSFPLRIWVIDNSGSMQNTDGHRFVETKRSDQVKTVTCSRWDEIRDCVNYHLRLSALLDAPTQFRMLNNPNIGPNSQLFSVGENGIDAMDEEVSRGIDIMSRARPGGTTPLCQHLIEIKQYIEMLQPELNAEGQRVVVVLATDGLPTDERGHVEKTEFVNCLRNLEGLPVWMVIRLCTDEDDVVEFYNDLDDQLEISLEVLDDFLGEAVEIYEHNPWLNYALPLHRLREMGYHDRVFDMLDERALTRMELQDFFCLLFGRGVFDGVDPEGDWKGFLEAVERLVKKEPKQWDPMSKKMARWINVHKLDHMYGAGSSCSIM